MRSDAAAWDAVPGQSRASGRPRRVGQTDVQRLEDTTRVLRARDYRAGGGVCYQAALGQLSWGHELLRAPAAERVRDGLVAAVADLHNLAGWTGFDAGRPGQALTHYRTALELISGRGRPALEANLRYRMGRIHLHHHAPTEALTEFVRSHEAAARAGSAHAASIASVNRAWAHAMRAEHEEAVRLLGRGQDEFADAPAEVPSWAAFFDTTDLAAMIGTVYTELAARGARACTRYAVPALATATRDYDDRMHRSRVFCLTMLALNHVLDGNLDHGARVATRAVHQARTLTSARVTDRMRPLLEHAARHPAHPGLTEVSERIRRLHRV
jgi:hypothetical protein